MNHKGTGELNLRIEIIYHYGIRPSFTTLLVLGGDIELNPGPAQKQERIENMYINQCQARKNRKHVMSVAHLNVRSVASRENLYLLKQTVTTNKLRYLRQSLSRGWTVQYATRIFLFRDIRLSGKIEGHTREAVEYLSVLKTFTTSASLKNGPQYLKAIFNNYG